MNTELILQLLLILFLTLINAYFACAEIAIVSTSRSHVNHMAEGGNKKAKTLLKLMDEPTKFLSTIQVGITLAGFFSSASAATGISDDLGTLLLSFNVPYSKQIALVGVTILLSYFTLVFGELVPKRIALQKAEKIALVTAKPISVILKFTAPFVKLLSLSTNGVLRLMRINPEGLDEKISREEIQSIVQEGEERGVINPTEKEMIDSIFDFDEILAKEIMTSRTDTFMINIDKNIEEYVDEILDSRFSRIPVFEDDSDNIIGILYLKDYVLQGRKVGYENVNIREILHTPFFVPERKTIDDLFKEMQANNKQIAILIDEYGGFSGIVTIQDIIEEVMGEIKDEDDREEWDIKKIDHNTYLIKGVMTIQDLNDELHLHLDEDLDDYDTVGGLIIHQLGYIPKEDERGTVELENLTFKILEVCDNRIEVVKMHVSNTVKNANEAPPETEE